MIRKRGSKYDVLSEKTGRRLGKGLTHEQAQRRIEQIEYFKARDAKKRAAPRRRK